MTDFRYRLYENYVTRFKPWLADEGDQAIDMVSPVFDALYAPLIESLAREERVIDLGCGSGQFLCYLESKGFSRVEGADLSDEQVALAQAKNLSVKKMDALGALGEESNQFGAVTSIDLVEHLTKDELLDVCNRIYDVLKPEGKVMIQTVNGAGLFPGQIAFGDLTHMTIMNPTSLKQLLTATGFTDIRFFESAYFPKTLRGTLRRIGWGLLKKGLNLCRYIECVKRQDIWSENMICVAAKGAHDHGSAENR